MCDNNFTDADKAALDALEGSFMNLPPDWRNRTNGCSGDIIQQNDDGDVERIFLQNMRLSGSLDLTKLPPQLKELWCCNNMLSGHLDLTQLPSSLEQLALYANSFTKIKMDKDKLPTSLDYVDFSSQKEELKEV